MFYLSKDSIQKAGRDLSPIGKWWISGAPFQLQCQTAGSWPISLTENLCSSAVFTPGYVTVASP